MEQPATHSDNFGLVLIEAMACGLPVITTNKVDISSEIRQAGAIVVDTEVGQLQEQWKTL